MAEVTVEKFIDNYPFLSYIKEDKTKYRHAKDAGWIDPYDYFLVGESGGILFNIQPGDRFINTHLFCEMAETYKRTKKYTNFKIDSIPHRQLRKREEYRRKHGIDLPCLYRNGEIQNLHISGAMYNYLNYTRMLRTNESTMKSVGDINTAEKGYDFPRFIDAQFWTFAVMEFAINNGRNLIIDKTRRGGFSYIMASDSANDINLNPHKTVIHVADDKKYLTKQGGLTDFTLKNLIFYENETFFKRGILTQDKENFVLGYKLPNGVIAPNAWNSGLFSVSAGNNPDCAIGKDAMKVKVEEVSTMTNYDDFMNVTVPAMTSGAYVTGNLFAWGTSTAGDMQIFATNFYNPNSFNCVPFENVWDKDCRNEVCGFFKPYAWGLEGQIGDRKAMDDDGNSDLEVGLAISFRNRKIKKETSETFAKYVNYLGQYALMPSESFSSTTENIFSSEELLMWEERLRTDNSFNFYVDGMLFDNGKEVIFKTNSRIEAEGGKHNVDFFDYIQNVPRKQHEHPHGCIRKWFNPLKMPHKNKEGKMVNEVPVGLYSITYDPVGINKEREGITLKHSHNSIEVWMNPTPYNNFKTAMVACYYGRPEKLEDADKILYLLARYYNCVGTTGVEVNRGETISNFTKWKALKYLMKDPVEVWDTTLKGKAVSTYGINMGSEQKKLEGLRLLKEMLYSEVGKDELDRPIRLYQTIYDLNHIVELKMWNNIGNYDRVSSMIIRGIQWRSANIEAAKELQHRRKIREEDVYNQGIMHRDWF